MVSSLPDLTRFPLYNIIRIAAKDRLVAVLTGILPTVVIIWECVTNRFLIKFYLGIKHNPLTSLNNNDL